jgi:alpha-beta hydrolase superfamily lysophospholipase
MRELRRTVTGFYTRSLHREHEGEWDFDLAWKPVQSWPVYAGWLRAIRHGHARLHAGLDVGCPTLVMSSATSKRPLEMGDDVHRSDVVLDVRQIRRWAPSLGGHVTIVAIQDARHDVVLSLPDVRSRAYEEMERWLGAYVP